MEPRANDGNMWRVARCKRCRRRGVIGFYTRKKGWGVASNRLHVDGWTHVCQTCRLVAIATRLRMFMDSMQMDDLDYVAERRWVDDGGPATRSMDGPH